MKVVEEYSRREQEIKQLEKDLEGKTAALNVYRQNISEVRCHVSAVDPLKCVSEFLYDRMAVVYACVYLTNCWWCAAG